MVSSFRPRTLIRGQHLLVGQDGPQGRAVPDRRLGHIGEAFLVQLKKNPLGPAEILRIGRVDLALPIVTEPHRLDLSPEVVDVLGRRDPRMGSGLHRVLLGWQAEGIPTHRMEHVHPTHPPVPRHDIGGGVALEVSDMQPRRRRVGEHVQNVRLGLFRAWLARLRGPETARLCPRLLPAGLDFSEWVWGADWHCLEAAIVNANPHAKSNPARALDCHPEPRQNPRILATSPQDLPGARSPWAPQVS